MYCVFVFMHKYYISNLCPYLLLLLRNVLKYLLLQFIVLINRDNYTHTYLHTLITILQVGKDM